MMKHILKAFVLAVSVMGGFCSCKIRNNDPERFQTPELFFDYATRKENCSVISSTYLDKTPAPDYNWTMKNACLEVEEYTSVSKFDIPKERYFTYEIFRNYTHSGANYVTLTIWDDGHLLIDHVVALTGHTKFYFTLDDIKAKELNDLAETMVLYAEAEAYKADEEAEAYNTIEHYVIDMRAILPVEVKLPLKDSRTFMDDGSLLDVIASAVYSKTTQEAGYFSDIALWYNSDYYNNNNSWIMFLNEDGDKIMLQYLYFDSLGRGAYNNAYYSLSSIDGQKILNKAYQMIK